MSIAELWLPILVSAVIVWIASALIWTVLPWHKSDYAKTGDEEGVRAALKGLSPGFYNVPHVKDMQDLKNPEVEQKFADGPVTFITVLQNGMPNMARNMVLQIAYFVFVGILCAYFVSRTTGPDANYLEVFRIAGTVAFVANGVGVVPDSIWFGRPWSNTAKIMMDGLIYGLLTGGVFGWLA
jgi:hypothetical protein